MSLWDKWRVRDFRAEPLTCDELSQLGAIIHRHLYPPAEHAAVEAALAWVPCAERLPALAEGGNDESDYVLVYLHASGAMDVARYSAAGEYREESCWWPYVDERSYHMSEVTHWMPLPEPPQ